MRIALLTVLAAVACTTTPTAEENALAAVEEIRVAMTGDDADTVWEHLSTRHRNLYEEARLARACLADPPDAVTSREIDLEDFAAGIPPGAAAEMTARDLHRALYEPAKGLPAVGEDVQIRFEADRADVDDPGALRRWWLRREGGAWKLDMLVSPDFYGAGMQVHTCPSGREIIFAVVVELGRKKVHEVPLPVVHGDTELGYPDLEIRLAVERDGRVGCRGEFLDDTPLKERLLVFAERKRDMEHPIQYSHVTASLAVHRELTWPRVEEVLWLLADPDVRIRPVRFLTAEYPDADRGLEIRLGAQARPTQIRYPEPDVEVRIGSGDVTPARLAGLAKALAARPDEDFEKGIRLYVSPDLRVGPTLSALAAVGRRGTVVHHLAPEPFAGWSLDGKTIEPVEGAEITPDPTTIFLTLVIRLPPGAETPTDLFRRLVVALDRNARHEIDGLLAPSVRAGPEMDSSRPWHKAKGATLKEVTVDGDRATVSFDGPQVLGVLYLVREDGRWYLAPAQADTTPR